MDSGNATIAYYSRKIIAAKLNYDVHDKELLAILYLEGPKYTVQKGSKNAQANVLSRQKEYSRKPTERPRAILKTTDEGMEYNHELLATIAIKDAYTEDECATRILKEPTNEFRIDQQGLLRFKGLVYIPSKMRRGFVKEQHSLPAHGYQGISKTYNRLSRDYYFPGIKKYVETTVTNCDLYNKNKANRHAPYGLLQPLEKSIAFDFIIKLPGFKEPITRVKFDFIWVVTDKLIKYTEFVPYKESSTAKELAYAFFKIIINRYKLLEEIISDRDKLFISYF
ncbi:Transposon Tf2-11 polyprotein [Lachnellula suecica]|uniref:Transposon Tf2-11 polyprotein n=1 Tax=Lachnellula suecica TaxID=602035 RepID=A0A8T9BRS7_9HELO|nr:Transposon Tf2-11 polyprotein [Lachnellula suecica]